MSHTSVGSAWSLDATTLSVLLVDDHHLLVDALTVVLERHGFRDVRAAVDFTPEGILAAASGGRPDVVLLDLDLGSHGSSVALVRPLTELGAAVIAIGEEVDLVGLATALELGAAGVISKTEGPDRLVGMLRDVARGVPAVSGPARAELSRALATERQKWGRFEGLSECERAVLALLTAGLAADEIALRRFVSLATVRSQIRSILRKLDVNSQVAAVALANRLGWSQEYEFA